MLESSFEWDDAKDRLNRTKHGVSFTLAQLAFFDRRVSLRKIWSMAAQKGDIFASVGSGAA
jgi:uncharacterized DUF497 family protein